MANIAFSLENQLFTGLARRKYSEKYTRIPASAYPTEVENALQKLYSLLGAPSDIEPLTVISSESGYPQRLAGPRIFRTAQDGLAIVLDRQEFPISLEVDEDGLVVIRVGGKTATLEFSGDQPQISLPLGNKNFLIIPFFTVPDFGGPEAFKTALAEGDTSLVSTQKVGGNNFFSALKQLPVGRYPVISTKMKDGGSYGMKAVFKLKVPSELIGSTIKISSKSPEGLWETRDLVLEEGFTLSVDSNKKLYAALFGEELTPDSGVVLEILGSRVEDNKTYVDASLDWTAG